MYTINLIVDIILSAVMIIESAFCLPLNTLLFRFDAEASVFETGDNMYTVMWSTSKPGTGYVTYTYKGTEYTVTDVKNGSVRSTETIHNVRIPKEHLDHNTYTYYSQNVGVKRAYTAIKGRTIKSDPVSFKGYDNQKEIKALLLSDIHENPFPVDKAVNSFEDDADLLIMNGDAVSNMTSSKKFTQILYYANRYSNGEIPVAYSRGNHENRGEYGADSVDNFKTTTGGMYYTFNYGPINFLVLDTGEDKDDTDWTYSGLADCTSYIAQETQWLKSITLDKNAACRICIGHMPYIESRYGFNWIDDLDNLGVDMFIGAHKHIVDFDYMPGSTPFVRIIDGGKSGNNKYNALMLNINNNIINAKAYSEKHTLVAEKTFEL